MRVTHLATPAAGRPAAFHLDRVGHSGYPRCPGAAFTSVAQAAMSAFSETFTLALHQLAANPTGADYLDRAIASVRDASARGANICVLPELFRSPYFCQEMEPRHFDLAEAIPGPTTEKLGALAAELGVVIVASLFERAMPGLYYNTTAVLDADGAYLGKYRKAHIPDDPLTDAELNEKFQELSTTRVGELAVRELSALIWQGENNLVANLSSYWRLQA